MASCVPAVKAALCGTVLPILFPAPIQVTYGVPGPFEGDDLVSVGAARVQCDDPVMSSARRVEETVELSILLSSWRAGGPQAQQLATEAAYAMLSTLRDHFRTAPNETIGGTCRTARVTSHELWEDDDPEAIANGRLSQIEVVLTISARQ